ncbi:ATP-binding cassette sub- C member 8 [Thoreauomyces humboldtii]|nr:ATP-binding cassette sub- C member 8 [Thoreauomyces humboldtii]
MGSFSTPRRPVDSASVDLLAPTNTTVSRNFLTFLTFSWMTPLLKLGNQRPLETEDLPNVPRSSQAKNLANSLDPFFHSLQSHLQTPTTVAKPSFALSIFRLYWSKSVLSLFLKLVNVASNLLMPYLISDVIKVLAATDAPKDTWFQSIYAYAGVYFALSLFGAVAGYAERAICIDIFIQTRAILIAAVYGKSLRLSPTARATYKAGTINSLVDVDAVAAADFNENFNGCLAAISQVALSLWLLARALGVTTWIATGTWLLLGLMIGGLMPLMGKSQKAYLAALDERTRVLREFLYGVSGLKLEGAVPGFLKRIEKARSQQLVALSGLTFVLAMIFSFLVAQLTALSTVTIVGYDKLGGQITAENVFPILGYLGALTVPSGSLMHYLAQTVQVFPSINRLTAFLSANEVTPGELTNMVEEKDLEAPAVSLDGACFSFSQADEPEDKDTKEKIVVAKVTDTKEPVAKVAPAGSGATDGDATTPAPFTLSDLSLSIPRGSLAVVVGSVGSGKSAFLSALAGSMHKTSGTATVRGTVALCLQSPWILSGSVQDNICGLFSATGGGRQEALAAAKSACLDQDLEVLGGLDAIVGEKGVQLSGGQRARIALARAIASDSSVLLLDDPLAALDARVGKIIFEDTLCKELKDRTRVIVTHQLQFAARADIVIVLDAGRIVETGAFRTLLAVPTSRLSFLMKSYRIDDLDADVDALTSHVLAANLVPTIADDERAKSKENDLENARKAVKEFHAKKAVAEDRRVGRVGSSTYEAFFRSSSPTLLAIALLTFLASTASSAWQSILLVQWSVESSSWTDGQYFEIFCATGVIRAVTYIVLIVAYFYSTFTASKQFHDKAMAGLACAPMSWYDDQPIGRIMNRMTADVKELDLDFSMVTMNLLITLSFLLTSIINLAYATPYMLIGFVVLTLPGIYIFKYYQSSYRELKRLNSILRSPLASHVSESLNGISTIKAYRASKRFVERQQQTTDLASKASFLRTSAEFWLGVRLAVLTSLVILASLLLAAAGVLSRSAIGLSLVSSMSLTDILITTLSATSATEAAFNAVERLDHYAHELPAESKQLDAEGTPKDWPRSGDIVFESVQLGYSAIAKPVVQDLSLTIASGEHLGVVGRTGAGKSTLMLSLFRIIEPQAGRIFIAGTDISSLSLQTLRTGITIIPQEPVLFSGSFRYNLDMESIHTDTDIWAALTLTGMKDHISRLPDKLESLVADSGTDLSAGQRQLICLAKAVLARPRILILDEAASAVDSAADQLLLSAILTEFKDTTVVSIAHRLGSVAGFDRIAVVDAGRLVEVGSPADLLDVDGGGFKSMVEATGMANAALIGEIAKRKRNREDHGE